ncbi:MAG: GTP-binding protein, partial [Eubacteriales bacterium]|nr:GTP-binding protein [Eubacteriales bacterium]
MKVLLLSGFLGAGKTTFIKAMMEATHRPYVIFENEFSDVNIDADLFRSDVEEGADLNVYELNDGCICCNRQGSFSSSLFVIQNTLDPDILIVEPSGVAKLSALIDLVEQVEGEQIQLLEPLCLIDATAFFKQVDRYPEIYQDQLLAAHRIQLTKTEQLSEDEISAVCDKVLELNPNVSIFREHYRHADEAYWKNLFVRRGASSSDQESIETGEAAMAHYTYMNARARGLTDVMRFLNQVLLGMFGDICRVKGCFQLPNMKLRVDLVDQVYQLTAAGDA